MIKGREFDLYDWITVFCWTVFSVISILNIMGLL